MRAVEYLKIEEAATNKLAEEYGQLQLNVIKDTIQRFVDFVERTGRKASESQKRLLEGMDFSVQQIQEYKAAAIGAEQYFLAGAKAMGASLENYNSALGDYTQVIKIEPNCGDAYFMRGCVYIEKGNRREAIADYNQVIKIDPDYADAYVQRGSIYRNNGDKKKAIADFQKAINIFDKESMLDEVQTLQHEVKTLQQEIKDTPWWQTRVF